MALHLKVVGVGSAPQSGHCWLCTSKWSVLVLHFKEVSALGLLRVVCVGFGLFLGLLIAVSVGFGPSLGLLIAVLALDLLWAFS